MLSRKSDSLAWIWQKSPVKKARSTMSARAFNPEIQAFHQPEESPAVRLRLGEGDIETFSVRPIQSPRRFERLLRGRPWREVAFVATSASGDAAIAHQMASLKAIEDAMDIELSTQTQMLRTLMLYGAHLSQIVTQLFYATTPQALLLSQTKPFFGPPVQLDRLIARAARIAKELQDIIGGQITYPMTAVPGGFVTLPAPYKLLRIRKRIEREMLPTLLQLSELFEPVSAQFPRLERKREFISLSASKAYPLYCGRITSSNHRMLSVYDYEALAQKSLEYVRRQEKGQGAANDTPTAERCAQKDGEAAATSADSDVKAALLHGRHMVGPLARINNNQHALTLLAREIADDLGLLQNGHNPFFSIPARLVEALQCAQKACDLIDEVFIRGLRRERPHLPRRIGQTARGVGCTESTNGLVFHDYTFDRDGRMASARCVSPINQNLPTISADLEQLLASLQRDGLDVEQIAFWSEVLVRSCDTSMVYERGFAR
jgi:coenzyme F420-reducing hydrogenase alpha subunit